MPGCIIITPCDVLPLQYIQLVSIHRSYRSLELMCSPVSKFDFRRCFFLVLFAPLKS